MMPWRAVRSLVAVAVMPLSVAAQDTENRVARAIDLAAAHAVGVDSQAVVAAQWRASLARTPSDRFAALGLASLARLTYDSTANHALALLAAGSDAVARRAMLGRALLVAATGRWAIADTLYADAAASASAAHDSILEADARFGRFAVTLARFAPDRVEVGRADSVRPRSDILLAAVSACAHAALAPSDSALRAATAQADQAGDARLAAACLNPLAGFLFSQRHEDSADAAASEVIARDRRARDRSALANALMFRCYRRLTLFDYGESAADCQEAVHEGAAIGSPYAVGWAELNLGALSRLLGDDAGARIHNARSRAVLSTIGDRTGLGILRRSDADLSLDAGDTANAHAAALDALHAARPGADAGGAWSRLADIALRERRFDEAWHDLDSNDAALRRGHAEAFLPTNTLKYGAILLREGRPGDALSRLLLSVYDTNQHVSRYLVSEQRAEALVALGQSAQAVDEMERATDDIERWRQTLTDRELRVLAFQTGHASFGGPSPGLALVVASAARHGSLERAFALAERQRARDLADQRRRAEAMRGGALPSATLPVTHIVTLAELRRAIPDDSTAVLEYVTGPAGAATTVFVVTRRTAVGRSLAPADSMADDIELFDDLIDQRRNTEAIALSLGSRALAPALVAVPPRIVRLVIVSDGPLHRIPFAALRVVGGATVVNRYAVSLAPSATVAADLWTHPVHVTGHTDRVLAFGDPIPDAPRAATGEEAERAASPLSLDPLTAGELPRLPWSADEARMAAAFGQQSVVLVGRDATPDALAVAPLDSFAIVHFATHALVDEQVPARSALVLSRGLGRSGLVDAGSLELHHVSASLIVLSACRTARGELVEGEGVRGLANPFLGAGAHAVLATQWAVGDRTVVPLVYMVYLGLAQGLPASEAVRRAEAAARRRGAPVREWAALTLMGDPLVRVRLRAPLEKQVPAWIRDAISATAVTPPSR